MQTSPYTSQKMAAKQQLKCVIVAGSKSKHWINLAAYLYAYNKVSFLIAWFLNSLTIDMCDTVSIYR